MKVELSTEGLEEINVIMHVTHAESNASTEEGQHNIFIHPTLSAYYQSKYPECAGTTSRYRGHIKELCSPIDFVPEHRLRFLLRSDSNLFYCRSHAIHSPFDVRRFSAGATQHSYILPYGVEDSQQLWPLHSRRVYNHVFAVSHNLWRSFHHHHAAKGLASMPHRNAYLLYHWCSGVSTIVLPLCGFWTDLCERERRSSGRDKYSPLLLLLPVSASADAIED